MTIVRGTADGVEVVRGDGAHERRGGLTLTPNESLDLFARNGRIDHVTWTISN
jgi:hypothetical protein